MRRRLPDRWTLLLAVVMAAALAGAVAYVGEMSGFFVQPDELTYVRGAIHIGEELRPVLPGDFWWSSYAQLLPLLLTPFYAALSMTEAFGAAHIVQAVVFVSTAVPVFLLGRRVTTHAAAAVAAALSVLVPWIAMTATVMTEPVAYAAHAWALLGLHVCLVRGGVRGDLIGLGAVALAFVSRTQFALLGPVLLVAVVAHETGWALAERRLGVRGAVAAGVRRALRRHRLLFGVAALAGAALLLGAQVLGSYGITTERTLLPEGALTHARDMFAFVAIAVGVLPLALAIAWWLMTLNRPADRPAHAFAVLSLVVVPVTSVAAGVFVENFALGAINDRYVMYLAPLLALGAVALLADRRPAVPALALGALLGAVLLATESIVALPGSMPSPARAIHIVLDGRMQQVGRVVGVDDLGAGTGLALALLLAVAVVAVLRARVLRPPAALAGVGVALIVAAALQTAYTLDTFAGFQEGVSEQFRENRSWIDREVGDDRKVTGFVGLTFDPAATAQVWWEATFFNRSADRLYVIDDQDRYSQTFAEKIRVGDRGRLIGDVAQRRLVLTSESEARIGFRDAREVARFNGLLLREVPVPYRLTWHLAGADGEGKVRVGDTAQLRVFGDGRARTRTVELFFATSVRAPRSYAVRVGGADGVARTRDVLLGEPISVRTRVRVPARGFGSVEVETFDPLPGPTPDPQAGVRLFGVGLD